jgi:pimeloyl-ACP methyl ester carboxylesterase/DNA-binding CsgD family transcriptional regulator
MDTLCPPVQFTKTDDGIKIAYWCLGRGEPIVQLPGLPYSHIEYEWRMRDLRRCYELLAVRRKLIRYDGRGSGLSDRETSDFTLTSVVRDLEAVMETLGPRPAALIATMNAAPVAISYAVNRPERVSHLLLWTPNIQPALLSSNVQMEAIWELLRRDFHLYSETVAHAFIGWNEPGAATEFAEFIRSSMTAENVLRFFDDMYATYDVLDLLPRIECPTLVMDRPEFPFLGEGVVADVAARIPGSTLVSFEGSGAVPYVGDWRAVARTISGFLGITPDMLGDRDTRTLRLISRRNDGLSDRERDVVQLVVQGLTNREISEELFLSEKTVENHVGRILDKLDLRSRTTLAAYAVEHGLHRRSA